MMQNSLQDNVQVFLFFNGDMTQRTTATVCAAKHRQSSSVSMSNIALLSKF